MLPFASALLLATAIVTALLVAVAARALLSHRAVGGTIAHRLPLSGRLCVQLAASVAIALAAFAIFIEVADNVIDQNELFHVDARVNAALAPLRGATGLAVARVVSALGSTAGLTVIALVVAATAYRRQWRLITVSWLLVLGGGKLVEQLLKHLFHRTRPSGAELVSYSYPSGHAMGSLIGYGILAYLVLLRIKRPAARVAITATAALLILAVGVSRLVLGVHYFTDVVGGYAAGAMWLVLSIAAIAAERARWPRVATADAVAVA
jgi:undecaprenyl-diphosphatase